MTSFRTFADWQSIRDMGLTTKVIEFSDNEAQAEPYLSCAYDLYNQWQAMAGDIPHYKEVKPSLFPRHLLSSMFIVDVEDAGQDFRWRLFGTDHTRRFGNDMTGKRVSTIAEIDESAAASLKFGKKCYSERHPVFFKIEYLENQSIKETTGTVILPLTGDDGKIQRLFGCSVWA